MMDFLRNLAPPRESDVTRAMPVLPPRFGSPTQQMQQRAQVAQSLDEIDFPTPSAKASRFTPPKADVFTQQRDAPRVEVPEIAHGPLIVENVRPENDAARPRPEVDITDAGPRFNPQRSEESGHATRIDAEPARYAAVTEAEHGRQPVSDVSRRSQPALPLSDAALAHRSLHQREASEVVHVTIGRIDVVANTTPPAPRRDPARRQATVTLADYLRGGNGARR